MDDEEYRKNAESLTQWRDHLALERTLLAKERTILAYVRTGLAFIGVGAFAIKFLDIRNKLIMASAIASIVFGVWVSVIGTHKVIKRRHERKTVEVKRSEIKRK